MSGLDGIFGLIGVGCGFYCLYGYYMLKFKGKIIPSLFLPKDTNMKKCKDYMGYCSEAQAPTLILGVVVLVYGAVDLYNMYVRDTGSLLGGMIVLVFAALFFFAVRIKKINKKYFDI